MAGDQRDGGSLDAPALVALSDRLWECLNSALIERGGELQLSPASQDRIPINPYLVAECVRLLPRVILGARVTVGRGGRHAKLATAIDAHLRDLDRSVAYWNARRQGMSSKRSVDEACRVLRGTSAESTPRVIRQALARVKRRLKAHPRSITPTEGVLQQLVRHSTRK